MRTRPNPVWQRMVASHCCCNPRSQMGRGAELGSLSSIAAHYQMKAIVSSIARKSLLLALLAVPLVFGCGCTSVLWDKETFAHHYRPARLSGPRFFYSEERKDILVQYEESKDGETNSRLRNYWLEANMQRVNTDRRPRFASVTATNRLARIPAGEAAPRPTVAGQTQLYAMARPDDEYFRLYSGAEEIGIYKLPVYASVSQKAKQVLLTPFAVAIDATIIGGVIAYFSAPQILAGLSQ